MDRASTEGEGYTMSTGNENQPTSATPGQGQPEELRTHHEETQQSEQEAPLGAATYITRENGARVPLIAVDELPSHVRIAGIPRVLTQEVVDRDHPTYVGHFQHRNRTHTVNVASHPPRDPAQRWKHKNRRSNRQATPATHESTLAAPPQPPVTTRRESVAMPFPQLQQYRMSVGESSQNPLPRPFAQEVVPVFEHPPPMGMSYLANSAMTAQMIPFPAYPHQYGPPTTYFQHPPVQYQAFRGPGIDQAPPGPFQATYTGYEYHAPRQVDPLVRQSQTAYARHEYVPAHQPLSHIDYVERPINASDWDPPQRSHDHMQSGDHGSTGPPRPQALDPEVLPFMPAERSQEPQAVPFSPSPTVWSPRPQTQSMQSAEYWAPYGPLNRTVDSEHQNYYTQTVERAAPRTEDDIPQGDAVQALGQSVSALNIDPVKEEAQQESREKSSSSSEAGFIPGSDTWNR